jgi:hypothetical protein
MRGWRWLLPVAIGAGIVAWVTALGLLALVSEGSRRFDEWQPWILLVNAVGVVVLVALIGRQLANFVSDWRRHVPGSRLRGRTMLMFTGPRAPPWSCSRSRCCSRPVASTAGSTPCARDSRCRSSRAALDPRMREVTERTGHIALTSGTGACR